MGNLIWFRLLSNLGAVRTGILVSGAILGSAIVIMVPLVIGGGTGSNAFVAPNGSDTGTNCKRFATGVSNPDATGVTVCRTLNKAYQLVSTGDKIEVATGSYPIQTINFDGTKGTTDVTIKAASGANPTVSSTNVDDDQIIVNADHLVLDGINANPRLSGNNDTVQNINAKKFQIIGAVHNATIKNSNFGPMNTCTQAGSHIKPTTVDNVDANGLLDPATLPTDILLDSVAVHDYTQTGCGTQHQDCLHIFESIRVTVRNSKFYNCVNFGIFLNSNGPGINEDDLFENNFFGVVGQPLMGFALRSNGAGDAFIEDFNGVTVRYNSAVSSIVTWTSAQNNVLTNVKWYGNIATDFNTCRAAVDYQKNIADTGNTCGATGIGVADVNSLFVNPATDDLHLLASATQAIDNGTTTAGTFPTTDFDGQTRPNGSAPDIGADER